MNDPKYQPLIDKMASYCADPVLQTYENYLAIKADPLYRQYLSLGFPAITNPIYEKFAKITNAIMMNVFDQKIRDLVEEKKKSVD